MEKAGGSDYMQSLRERKNRSHVYVKYQSTGLALAEILEDRAHKALYMRLAKTYYEDDLMTLAKSIATREQVKNRGAYFMKLLKEAPLKKRPVVKKLIKKSKKIKKRVQTKMF